MDMGTQRFTLPQSPRQAIELVLSGLYCVWVTVITATNQTERAPILISEPNPNTNSPGSSGERLSGQLLIPWNPSTLLTTALAGLPIPRYAVRDKTTFIRVNISPCHEACRFTDNRDSIKESREIIKVILQRICHLSNNLMPWCRHGMPPWPNSQAPRMVSWMAVPTFNTTTNLQVQCKKTRVSALILHQHTFHPTILTNGTHGLLHLIPQVTQMLENCPQVRCSVHVPCTL